MISKKEIAKFQSKKNAAEGNKYKKYTVDFTGPVKNKLTSSESCVQYLTANMKINGLKGKLEDYIKISSNNLDQKSTIVIHVLETMQFSKRYIRYLVKKYLKRENISKYLTVNASAPNAYTVKVIEKNE